MYALRITVGMPLFWKAFSMLSPDRRSWPPRAYTSEVRPTTWRHTCKERGYVSNFQWLHVGEHHRAVSNLEISWTVPSEISRNATTVGGVLSSMPTLFAHAAWYFVSPCVTLVLSISCHLSPGMFDSHLWSKEVNKVCTWNNEFPWSNTKHTRWSSRLGSRLRSLR